MSDPCIVKMLGGFSITCGDRTVDDGANRMRKVWLLLAYLIYARNNRSNQDTFLSLLGGSSEDAADPNGKVKAMFYRARTLLDELGEGFGHQLVVRASGSYAWSDQVETHLDVDEFDQLYDRATQAQDPEEQLALYQQAIQLFRGDFLPKLSMEPWVMPIHAYYHQRYLDAVSQALTLLEARQDWETICQLCETALKIEPYSETVYQHLMRARIAREDRAGAISAYEEMSELLFSTFGVMPSDESRQLYRTALRETDTTAVPAGTVRDMLKEPAGANGAMLCEYDFFKLLYQVQARSILRTGDTVHIALLSLHGPDKQPLARRSLDTAMDNLQDIVIRSLRQGDMVTKCSVSQFIIMLPQANYENSCAVCQRVLRAFSRQYPHSPARITFSVHALEPNTPADRIGAGVQ